MVVRESDTLARIGGDEFVFSLPQIAGKGDVEKVAMKIKKISRRDVRTRKSVF
jgi:GGDEF domain-containing protein